MNAKASLAAVAIIALIIGAAIGALGMKYGVQPVTVTSTATVISTVTKTETTIITETPPTITTQQTSTSTTSVTTTQLSPVAKEALIYMVQEEKLARDVYLTLAKMYPTIPIFSNIADSEQTHVNAVMGLLEKYGIKVELGPVGEFQNKTFTDLYKKLVDMGSKNVTEALKVGCMIEELDIKDLHEWIEKVQSYPDIVKVFEFLMMGSRNHLRSFYWTLKNVYGIEYHPQYISVEEFNQIINSPMEIPATSSVPAGTGGGQHGKPGG